MTSTFHPLISHLCLQGHKSWKKFKNGLPPYLPELDKMFEGVAVDGSTSFVPAVRCSIQCDSSDEEATDEEDEQLTLLSNSTPRTIPSKRGSSTCSKAKGPKVQQLG
jgi:hypothetical protein